MCAGKLPLSNAFHYNTKKKKRKRKRKEKREKKVSTELLPNFPP